MDIVAIFKENSVEYIIHDQNQTEIKRGNIPITTLNKWSLFTFKITDNIHFVYSIYYNREQFININYYNEMLEDP